MNAEYTLRHGGRLWFGKQHKAPKGTVIICPGGGYGWLSPREAEPVADAFWENGWAAAVLYYSVGQELGTLPLKQLGEAVAVVREREKTGQEEIEREATGQDKIEREKTGQEDSRPVIICGFSAGGHLAASLGVYWKTMGLPCPDGLILCYPVISAGAYGHQASIRRLAGDGDSDFYSLEHHVNAHMPPVFLWHTRTDPEVPVQNSLLLAEAMAKAGVEFELLVYPRGAHGLSLATPQVEEPEKGRFADPHIAGWFRNCLDWLDTLNLNKEST